MESEFFTTHKDFWVESVTDLEVITKALSSLREALSFVGRSFSLLFIYASFDKQKRIMDYVC